MTNAMWTVVRGDLKMTDSSSSLTNGPYLPSPLAALSHIPEVVREGETKRFDLSATSPLHLSIAINIIPPIPVSTAFGAECVSMCVCHT